MVSMAGTWMQSTVQAWLVYRLSHSTGWLGIITFCTQFPAFIISPVAGIIADHKDRKKILMWTGIVGLLQALALSALVFTGQVNLWHITFLSVVLGLVNGFELTTRHAFAMDLVGKSDLNSAIALNSTTINSSRILGPALAGICINWIGEAWCFIINSMSYLAIIASLLMIKMEPRTAAITDSIRIYPALSELRAAITYIRGVKRIRRLMLIAAAVSFVAFPYTVLLPAFAKTILHGDAVTLSSLMAMTGFGAIMGALASVTVLNDRYIERKLTMSMVKTGGCLCVLGLSNTLWLSLLCTFGLGFFLMGMFPIINTAIQQTIEDSLRGRVLSLYTMTFLGAMPLGGLMAGWLADHLGVQTVTISTGIICAGLGLIFNSSFQLEPNSSFGARGG
mgnify:CR=1 FL=1